MMNKISQLNLNNLHVLVTRPKPYGEELCELIRLAQGYPIYFPTIAFELLQDVSAINKISQQDWLIFVSPQAVNASITAIKPKLSSQTKVAAIGSGTAQALQKQKVTVDLFPEKESDSESLLALLTPQLKPNNKIMLVRGEGGRTLLAENLAAEDMTVEHYIAYRRSLPILSVPKERIDIVVCTSNESLKNLQILYPEALEKPLIVVSERMREYAKTLGIQHIKVAKGASHQAILETLMKIDCE